MGTLLEVSSSSNYIHQVLFSFFSHEEGRSGKGTVGDGRGNGGVNGKCEGKQGETGVETGVNTEWKQELIQSGK